MSESFDFEDDSTKIVSETQQIDETTSSSEDEKKISILKPTQAILTDSDDHAESEELPGNSMAISPVFHSNRTRTPSPVFPSQSLLQTSKRAKRTLWKAQSASSEDMFFQPSQNIESVPSTQSPTAKHLSGDSTKISSPGSFQSADELAAIADLDTFRYLHQQSRSDKKIKRPKKGGLVEKLDLAMKQKASDHLLNQHLPLKLRKNKTEKKTVSL